MHKAFLAAMAIIAGSGLTACSQRLLTVWKMQAPLSAVMSAAQ